MLTIRIEGKPIAWSRPRPRRYGGFYSPHKETGWYAQILLQAKAFKPASPMDGPLRLSIEFLMPRPQARKKDTWHIVRPDRDNLEKLVSDALKDAGWMRDDSQVCSGPVEKRYPKQGEMPGALITLERIA